MSTMTSRRPPTAPQLTQAAVSPEHETLLWIRAELQESRKKRLSTGDIVVGVFCGLLLWSVVAGVATMLIAGVVAGAAHVTR